MADWYYAQGGQQLGPVADVQLQQLAAAGHIRPGDLVWAEGMPSWTPAGSVPNLFPPGAIQPAAAAPQYAQGQYAYPGEQYPQRPRRRQSSGGLGAGAMLGRVGGVVAVIGVVVIAVVVIVNAGGASGPGPRTWADPVSPGPRFYNITFRGGVPATFSISGQGTTDVELYVYEGNGRPV